MDSYPSCNITFKLLYRIGDAANQTLETWQEAYGDGIRSIDIDLSLLAGQRVEFILRTINSGASASNAQGFWMTPGIENIKPQDMPLYQRRGNFICIGCSPFPEPEGR